MVVSEVLHFSYWVVEAIQYVYRPHLLPNQWSRIAEGAVVMNVKNSFS